MTSIGTARSSSSHSRSDIRAIARNSDSAMVPDVVDGALVESDATGTIVAFRTIAATIIAPM